MATTNATMRMDEDLKKQLQELVSNLGMDMTTFLLYQQNRQQESSGYHLIFQ